MLSEASVPLTFWGETLSALVHVLDRTAIPERAVFNERDYPELKTVLLSQLIAPHPPHLPLLF